ncbi:MAG: hypothetical protein U0Q16_16020 [Bryobacteraceae bacterium]
MDDYWREQYEEEERRRRYQEEQRREQEREETRRYNEEVQRRQNEAWIRHDEEQAQKREEGLRREEAARISRRAGENGWLPPFHDLDAGAYLEGALARSSRRPPTFPDNAAASTLPVQKQQAHAGGIPSRCSSATHRIAPTKKSPGRVAWIWWSLGLFLAWFWLANLKSGDKPGSPRVETGTTPEQAAVPTGDRTRRETVSHDNPRSVQAQPHFEERLDPAVGSGAPTAPDRPAPNSPLETEPNPQPEQVHFRARHDKRGRDHPGELTLQDGQLIFESPGHPEWHLTVARDEIKRADKNGVLLHTGERYHFHVDGLTDTATHDLFLRWMHTPRGE